MRLFHVAPVVALGLIICCTSCAPEPSSESEVSPESPLVAMNEDWSSWGEKAVQLEGETSETLPKEDGILDGRQPVELEKSGELPTDFPKDSVVLPDDLIVDDAGSRGDGQWFAVFAVESLESANELIETVALSSGFNEQQRSQNDDGGWSLEYQVDSYRIEALTFAGAGGEAFLNLEIVQG